MVISRAAERSRFPGPYRKAAFKNPRRPRRAWGCGRAKRGSCTGSKQVCPGHRLAFAVCARPGRVSLSPGCKEAEFGGPLRPVRCRVDPQSMRMRQKLVNPVLQAALLFFAGLTVVSALIVVGGLTGLVRVPTTAEVTGSLAIVVCGYMPQRAWRFGRAFDDNFSEDQGFAGTGRGPHHGAAGKQAAAARCPCGEGRGWRSVRPMTSCLCVASWGRGASRKAT